ncbi:hypothetical protein HK405_009405 [Cladochytrium tenue]|nr:hypothetical protein HK405_009405 [Cladochytrium tenue]
MKALVTEGVGKPLALKSLPTPAAVPGSCVVKVLAVAADSGIVRLLSGRSSFTYPGPFTPGGRAIGRVAAVGSDAARLRPGQLVMLESFLRARDDPTVEALWAAFDGATEESRRFVRDNWTMGCFAEFVRAPLENVHALDEERLCGELGYSFADLLPLTTMLIGYAGLAAIGVKPGETVVISPATGAFSGGAVQCAVAIGATVIAMGRSEAALRRVQAVFPPGRVRVVSITGNAEADAASLKAAAPAGRVDAFIDLSPFVSKDSTHVRSGFLSLRKYGRACMMGVIPNDLALPYAHAVWNNITIRGQYMYDRHIPRELIKLAETGVLKLGKDGGNEIIGTFPFERLEEALELSVQEGGGFGQSVIMVPQDLSHL